MLCRNCQTLAPRPTRCVDLHGNEIGRLCIPCMVDNAPQNLTPDECEQMVVHLMDAVRDLRRKLDTERTVSAKWFQAWLKFTTQRERPAAPAATNWGQVRRFLLREPDPRAIRLREDDGAA